MNLPALYARIGYDAARREMLSGARPLVAALGELSPWWVTPSALVCFTDVGPRRRGPVHHSFFPSARRLEWVAPPGAPSLALGDYPSIPREVRARENGGRSLHLFARGPEDDFTYLGEMAPSYAYGGNAETQRATFELHRTVPSALLAMLGVLSAEHEHPESLDEGLHSLAQRPLGSRIELLKDLAEYWHGPLSPADGYAPSDLAGLRIPDALRRWFLNGGQRAEVFGAQNRLLGPSEPQKLYLREDKLVFYLENQAVWEMATLPDGDDPPVWSRENEPAASWSREEGSLSVVTVQACIFEAVMQAMYGGSVSWGSKDLVDLIARSVRELPYSGWRLPHARTRFFASGGAFAVVMSDRDDEREGSVWVGAKTEHPLRFLQATDPKLWEHAAF